MLKLGGRQLLVVLLCVLMSNPPSIVAASTPATSRDVVGSIATTGSVRVGEVLVPMQGTIFAGDRVNTNTGSAIIQYRDGAKVTLSSGSMANFATNRVQLEKGLMTFQTAKTGVVFAASSLRLEPTTAKASANVTLNNSKASVAVTEGTVKVLDPSGYELISLNAGDARLFSEAPASALDPAAASPASASAAPQGNGGGKRTWMIGLGVALIGTAIALTALSRSGDWRDSDTAAQTQARVDALSAQLTLAQNSLNAATTRLNFLAQNSAGLASLVAEIGRQQGLLADALAALGRVTQQLASNQITPAQANAMLLTIQGTINTVNANLLLLNQRLIACSNTIGTPAASVVPFCQAP